MHFVFNCHAASDLYTTYKNTCNSYITSTRDVSGLNYDARGRSDLRWDSSHSPEVNENINLGYSQDQGYSSLVPRPRGRREKCMAWYPLFAHARTIPEIFHELVRLWTSYTWLLCGEITELDIRLAVWQLCLLGIGFHYQRHKR